MYSKVNQLNVFLWSSFLDFLPIWVPAKHWVEFPVLYSRFSFITNFIHTTEDEMAGWHHWLDVRGSEWTPGVGDGQGDLACCNAWGRKESNTTERMNWTECIYVNANLPTIIAFWLLNFERSLNILGWVLCQICDLLIFSLVCACLVCTFSL